MPASRVVTPQMHTVRALADQALTLPEGLRIIFTPKSHGSYEAARSASRGFQSTFSALRAKTRRRTLEHQGIHHNPLDTHWNGPYDALACMKSELPDGGGWSIHLCKAHAINIRYDVVDGATGEPLKQFDPDEQRLDHLIALYTEEFFKSKDERRAFRWPWTEEEQQWLWKNKEEIARDCWERVGANIPTFAPGYVAPVLINSEHDVASVSADDMFAPDPDEDA